MEKTTASITNGDHVVRNKGTQVELKLPLFIENLILYSDKPWKLTKGYKLVIEQGMEQISIMILYLPATKPGKTKCKTMALSTNVKTEILEICLKVFARSFFLKSTNIQFSCSVTYNSL